MVNGQYFFFYISGHLKLFICEKQGESVRVPGMGNAHKYCGAGDDSRNETSNRDKMIDSQLK